MFKSDHLDPTNEAFMSYNSDNDNRGNRLDSKHAERENDLAEESQEADDAESSAEALEPINQTLSLHLSQSLVRKLRENAREEGVSIEDLASELIAEGVVLRAWEIVERKHAMRGGNPNQNSQNNFNRGGSGNVTNGNNAHGHAQQQRQFQNGGNKQAQKKLARQARQHANAMDLLQDKAAFLEYVRSQEQKRR